MKNSDIALKETQGDIGTVAAATAVLTGQSQMLKAVEATLSWKLALSRPTE